MDNLPLADSKYRIQQQKVDEEIRIRKKSSETKPEITVLLRYS
jgi:hypothetical protein